LAPVVGVDLDHSLAAESKQAVKPAVRTTHFWLLARAIAYLAFPVILEPTLMLPGLRQLFWLPLALIFLSLAGCNQSRDVMTLAETRLNQYVPLRAEWYRRGLADHFPVTIPANASQAKLSSLPKFMQGGGWFQLRLTLPEAEVASIFEDATKRAKAFYDGGRRFQLVDARNDGLPGAGFYTGDTLDRDFPADYRVFVFAARSYRPGEAMQWNHGDCRGVVVSRTRHEVIYFAENW
jgi:hypothetical protein